MYADCILNLVNARRYNVESRDGDEWPSGEHKEEIDHSLSHKSGSLLYFKKGCQLLLRQLDM